MPKEGGVHPYRFAPITGNDTHFEYVSSANWHTSPLSSKGSPLTQFTSKEAVLLPHDIYKGM